MRQFPRHLATDPKSQIDRPASRGAKFTPDPLDIGLFRQTYAFRNHPLQFYDLRATVSARCNFSTAAAVLPSASRVELDGRFPSQECACSRRCSTFECRSTDRDDVFLMNTFTDAQLIVSRDVVDAARSGRSGVRARPTATSARRSSSSPRTASSSPIARPSATTLEDVLPRRARGRPRPAARHGADDAAVQLRLRLLHPGRPRRLQQDRREDVDGDGGAARRRWIESRLDTHRARSASS